MNRLLDRSLALIWLITTPAVCVAIWMTFVYAPEEKIMGAAQKIFYFHVPAAIVTYVAVFALLGGSIGYLWTRNMVWDHFSRAATEAGLLFCTLVLLTGPIWAKPAWGVWWTWEARLTTTLILWLLLVSCLLVRRFAEHPDLGARMAAIVGIFAAVDVPIIHKAVEWWRGHHPQVFKPGGGGGLGPKMAQTLGVASLAILMLFVLVLLFRWRTALVEQRVQDLAERCAESASAGRRWNR